MANPLQIVSKSTYIDEKAKAIFQSLLADYQQGKIKSQSELAYRVYRALMDFYAQIGKPSLVVREAEGPPTSADHNAMLSEISNDLTALFAELRLMSGAIGDSFGYVETERQAMLNQAGKLTDRIQTLREAAAQRPGESNFRDSFLDRSHFDVEMVQGTPAEISDQANALMLGLADAAEVREGITVTILPASNGLPGNTHQVKPGDGFYRFQGEDHMRIDLQALLDGNADTWFEFESIAIPEKVRELTGGLGFAYHEGVSWLKPDSEPLRLTLKLELDRPQMMNWLTLNPFIPAEKGAGPARVMAILLEDGKGQSIDIADGALLGDERVFLFPKMKVKRLTLTLEQSTGYETLVGHMFFKELEQVLTSIFELGKTVPGKRVDGPRPEVRHLGLAYDPATGSVKLPSERSSDPVPDRTEAAQALFGIPEVAERIQAGVEAVPAQRFAIGVRDIGMASYRFAPESVYISKPYTADAAIRRVTLDADEEIPVEFPEGTWIEYHLSADGGKSWHPIAPEGTLGAGLKTEYLIGTRTPAAGRRAHIGYLEPEGNASEVRLKITLRRPGVDLVTDADYVSPIVYEYRLNVMTEGGALA